MELKVLCGGVSEKGSWTIFESGDFKSYPCDNGVFVAGFRWLPYEWLWSLQPGTYISTCSVNYPDDETILIKRI